MMKRGAKRPAFDSSDPDLRSKKILDSPFLNAHRAGPEPSVAGAPQLDPKRAALSQQHVRALNTQFASWVQLQLQNHPDELWEDGAKDYISHASHIMEKFKDVVDWLRENAAKSGSASTSELPNEKTNFITVSQNNKPQFRADINNGFAQATTSSTISSFQSSGSSFVTSSSNFPPSSQGSGSFRTSQSSSLFSSSKSSSLFSTPQSSSLFSIPQSSSLFSTQQSSGLFSTPKSSGLFPNSQNSVFFPSSQSSSLVSSSQSSGLVSSSQSTGSFPSSQSSGLVSSSQSTGLFPSSQSSGFVSSSQSTPLFPSSQSSGLVSSSQSPSLYPSSQSSGLFSWSQTPSFPGTQTPTLPKHEASEDADEENESEKPSSPSLKRTEEKGVVVVHEVKCKVYIKPDNSAEKGWKDIGVGQLSIKCREGVDKATKESKPTIVIRNDVGRILLNALIYPGIKMNIQKKTVASIFHTSGGNANGSEGDNTDAAVARTYLFRLRTEEEATELATTIKEYAPPC